MFVAEAKPMGIGMVLFGWLMTGAILALVASVVSGIVVLWMRSRAPLGGKWVGVAMAIPFALLAYVVVAYVGYATWCVTLRGVDPVFGDAWHVPLGHGWEFLLIDTMDDGQVRSQPEDPFFYIPGVTRLGSEGRYVFGETTDGFFFTDMTNAATEWYGSEGSLWLRLTSAGLGRAKLQSARAFYSERRWTYADGIAAIVLGVPPLALLAFVADRLLRAIGGRAEG